MPGYIGKSQDEDDEDEDESSDNNSSRLVLEKGDEATDNSHETSCHSDSDLTRLKTRTEKISHGSENSSVSPSKTIPSTRLSDSSKIETISPKRPDRKSNEKISEKRMQPNKSQSEKESQMLSQKNNNSSQNRNSHSPQKQNTPQKQNSPLKQNSPQKQKSLQKKTSPEEEREEQIPPPSQSPIASQSKSTRQLRRRKLASSLQLSTFTNQSGSAIGNDQDRLRGFESEKKFSTNAYARNKMLKTQSESKKRQSSQTKKCKHLPKHPSELSQSISKDSVTMNNIRQTRNTHQSRHETQRKFSTATGATHNRTVYHDVTTESTKSCPQSQSQPSLPTILPITNFAVEGTLEFSVTGLGSLDNQFESQGFIPTVDGDEARNTNDNDNRQVNMELDSHTQPFVPSLSEDNVDNSVSTQF